MNPSMMSGPAGTLLALYVGPDQVMPVASVLATILGFLLIFWHKLLALLRKFFAIFRRTTSEASPSSSADASAKKASGQS